MEPNFFSRLHAKTAARRTARTRGRVSACRGLVVALWCSRVPCTIEAVQGGMEKETGPTTTMMLRHAYLAEKLVPHPLPTRDAGVLYTVRDARAYLLALPPYRERRNHWQRAGQLIPEEADVEAVSQQFHRALFMDGKLSVNAFERMGRMEAIDINTSGRSALNAVRLLAAPQSPQRVIEPESARDQTERRRHPDGLARSIANALALAQIIWDVNAP